MTSDGRGIVVLVVGTGTEVGKTWVSARVLEAWRAAGVRARARKPAQSFDPGDDDAGHTDAQVLAAASGEHPHDVCPASRWYPVPMAPPMAAHALGREPVLLADLLAELRIDATADVTLVETAGGVRSPLADDGDAVAFVDLLHPDHVLLVADAGLGTINAVRSSLDALARGAAHPPLTVFLNRYQAALELHQRNRAWLAERDGLDVLVDPVALARHLVPTGTTGDERA